MIRHLIVLAFGSFFSPPPHFVLTLRPISDGSSSSLGSFEKTPVPRTNAATKRVRIGHSASRSVFQSVRINIPRGVHRDARGNEVSARRESPAPVRRRRNGSRK